MGAVAGVIARYGTKLPCLSDRFRKVFPWASPKYARLGLQYRIGATKQMVVWALRLDPHYGEVDPFGSDSFQTKERGTG